jgi:tRNA-dihydrouridine synthase B
VELVKKSGKNILVIGNGDVKNLEEAKKRIAETGCDGVMIGRGTFGNPWIFSDKNYEAISLKEKIKALIEHIKIFDQKLIKNGIKKYPVMKKHFKAYINGFDGAKELRNELMNTEKPIQSIKILADLQKTLK